MKKQKIIIVDFEEYYPPIDNPLKALLLSLVEKEEYTCVLCTSNKSMVEYAKEHAIPCTFIAKPSSRNVYTLFSLFKILRKKNALIHVFGTRAIEIVTPLYHYLGKAKVVYTFTSPPHITSLSKLQKQYQNVSIITAPTRHFVNTMAHVLQLPQSKTAVVPIGITKELYPTLSTTKERLIFTVVAPLEEGNSLFEILDSLSVLHKAHMLPEWEVRFIGTGSLFSAMIEYATTIGIVDRIALLGEYPLPSLLEKTRILILPVFFWYISQAIYGGIISHIPIVHTKDPNILDIVNFHHNDVCSFTQGDSTEIRSAIRSAVESQQVLQVPIYSLEETVLAFHAIYRRLL